MGSPIHPSVGRALSPNPGAPAVNHGIEGLKIWMGGGGDLGMLFRLLSADRAKTTFAKTNTETETPFPRKGSPDLSGS